MHFNQDVRRIIKMLESIERDYDINSLTRFGGELALVRNASLFGGSPPSGKMMLLDIYPDHVISPALG